MEEVLLHKLNEFGLNTYESRLWIALLSKDTSTAGELADVANVPRSRSYDVLESLRKKGFVNIKPGKPIKYVAVSPESVIKRRKEKIKESAQKQIKLIEDFKTKEMYKELENIHKQSFDVAEPSEFVGFFKEKQNIKNKLRYMLKNAKESVFIVETVNNIEKNFKFFEKTLKILEDKGVKVRLMVNSNNKSIKKAFSDLKEVKETKLPNRFYIVDGREMMFMLFQDSDVGIIANTKPFIQSVVDLFNKQWESS